MKPHNKCLFSTKIDGLINGAGKNEDVNEDHIASGIQQSKKQPFSEILLVDSMQLWGPAGLIKT